MTFWRDVRDALREDWPMWLTYTAVCLAGGFLIGRLT